MALRQSWLEGSPAPLDRGRYSNADRGRYSNAAGGMPCWTESAEPRAPACACCGCLFGGLRVRHLCLHLAAGDQLEHEGQAPADFKIGSHLEGLAVLPDMLDPVLEHAERAAELLERGGLVVQLDAE